MKVSFDKSFYKYLKKITDTVVLNKAKQVILKIEGVDTLSQVSNVKKMEGFKDYYRIRIGDYRIGVEQKGENVRFIIIANRKDIYKKFP